MSSTDTSVDDTARYHSHSGQQTWFLSRQSRPFQKVSSQLLALNDPSVRLRGQGLRSVNN